jgi:hypothetical protein
MTYGGHICPAIAAEHCGSLQVAAIAAQLPPSTNTGTNAQQRRSRSHAAGHGVAAPEHDAICAHMPVTQQFTLPDAILHAPQSRLVAQLDGQVGAGADGDADGAAVGIAGAGAVVGAELGLVVGAKGEAPVAVGLEGSIVEAAGLASAFTRKPASSERVNSDPPQPRKEITHNAKSRMGHQVGFARRAAQVLDIRSSWSGT